jgi:hypothetical protein
MDDSIKQALKAIENGPTSKALGALNNIPSGSRRARRASTATVKFWDTPTTVGILIILAALTGGIYGLVVLLDRTLTAATLQSLPVKLAVSATLLVGAILLYMVKVSSAQYLYGLTEIAVGLVANWRSLEGLAHQLASPTVENPLFARLAVLAGGLYLIGRGVANFAEGMRRLVAKRKLAQGPDKLTSAGGEEVPGNESHMPSTA